MPANVQLVNFNGTNEVRRPTRCSLTLEGIVAGDVPRLAADQFRTALTDSLGKSYQGVSAVLPQPGRHVHAGQPQRQAHAHGPLHHRGEDEQARRRVPPTAPAPERRKHLMNKLNKDQIQKIFLSGLLMIGAGLLLLHLPDRPAGQA